jgi:hypothetical protein
LPGSGDWIGILLAWCRGQWSPVGGPLNLGDWSGSQYMW